MVRRAQWVVAPLRCQHGKLRSVGRSTPLRADTVRQLSGQLTAAGPDHPWKGVRFTASWGSRTPLNVVLVEPDLVAEMTVDTARERGAWRHPVRFARLRLDVAAADVPTFGAAPNRPDEQRVLLQHAQLGVGPAVRAGSDGLGQRAARLVPVRAS